MAKRDDDMQIENKGRRSFVAALATAGTLAATSNLFGADQPAWVFNIHQEAVRGIGALVNDKPAGSPGTSILSPEQYKKMDDIWNGADSNHPDRLTTALKRLSPEDRPLVTGRLIYRALKQGKPEMVGSIFAAIPEAKNMKYAFDDNQPPVDWQRVATINFTIGKINGLDAEKVDSNKWKYELHPHNRMVEDTAIFEKKAIERMGHGHGGGR